MYKNTPKQLTNRHFAKLITKLEPLNIPKIAHDAIKREMFYLMEDIVSLSENKETKNEERNYNQ